MRNYLLYTIALVSAQCNPDRDARIYSYLGRTIIDSIATGTEFYSFDRLDNGAYYPVYYIGKQADSLFLGREPISMFKDYELESKYDTARNWNRFSTLNIMVFVDTTMHSGYEISYTHFSEERQMDIPDSTKSIKSFVLFITNLSDSLVFLGTHNFVGYVTREVQDQNGNWIEVEQRFTGLCATAKRDLILEPGDIIVAKLLRYKGDARHLCRLKLSFKFGDEVAYTTYSNVFEDYFDFQMQEKRRPLAIREYVLLNENIKPQP
jgi:hypothetical protein